VRLPLLHSLRLHSADLHITCGATRSSCAAPALVLATVRACYIPLLFGRCCWFATPWFGCVGFYGSAPTVTDDVIPRYQCCGRLPPLLAGSFVLALLRHCWNYVHSYVCCRCGIYRYLVYRVPSSSRLVRFRHVWLPHLPLSGWFPRRSRSLRISARAVPTLVNTCDLPR